ncbi:peptidoglycan D,D-transpeptidase FtsI family protein [Limisalsivibrio acetivorans]|uniref:peptidoglycan D,D-transpeptidase FtsI family protein n=1 Tax=Limisalsivibrio acetivorans TaxID=1304888 RepID=UPI0003B393F9|nr:penicillin-binding protein 2 [Limisalsivibrio acetivorans]
MFSEKSRILFFLYVCIFFALVIGVRLFHLQVLEGDFYAKLAGNQAEKTITTYRGRGEIYDRTGKPMAINRRVASVFVFGSNLKDRRKFIIDLANNGITMSKSNKKRVYKSDGFVWIKRNIGIEEARELKKNIPELDYTVTENRLYPENELASSVIGFTGTDNQGLWGLEGRFEKVLKGDKTELVSLRDSTGRLILFEDTRDKKRTVSSVHTTIDMYLQGTVEHLLREDAAAFRAREGVAVAMDVKTGDILFAASSGGFDPNNFRSYGKSDWKNRAATFLYEPGSIFKPVSFSYLLDRHSQDIEEKVDCEMGRYTIYGHTIKDVHRYGMLTAKDVLVKSSNIGIIKLTKKVKNEDFYEFLSIAGFGAKTGVLGLGEEEGLLRSYKNWSGLSRPSLSMGQEILVTPLQMVRFYAAVANGGFLLKPRIVKEVSKNGRTVTPEVDRLPIMSETSATKLGKILAEVVEEGTGKRAKSSYIDIAGKTGTGQRFDSEKGEYSSRDYAASFAGFFPADDPKIAMVVVYDSPRTSIYGGSTAARTYRKIAEIASLYLGLKRNVINESL